jgi:hypothetical protein
MESAAGYVVGIDGGWRGMIPTQTAFVLGAGAHVPYGMPSGAQLTKKIIESFPERPNRQCEFINLYYGAYGNSYQIEKACTDFRHKLTYGIQGSIDSFLRFYSDKPHFPEIGKLAVAKVLLPMEFKQKWQRRNPDDKSDNHDWMTYLFEIMYHGCHESIEQFIERNKVSFITFNYDRTLEHFTMTKLANTYGLSREATWNKLRAWDNIVHVYGSLGEFSEKALEEEVNIHHAGIFKIAAASMKLMYDDRAEEKTIERAKERLKDACSISFLGCAFDPENIARMELNTVCNNKSVLAATRYGVTDTEWSRIARSMSPSGFTGRSGEKDDCRAFLRNVNVL